jgi:hypothetical protein
VFITLAQERDAQKQSVAAATPLEPPNGGGVGEGQGKDASMHVASFVKVALASFLSDQVKPAREDSSSEPIPAPSRALPLRSNLVEFQKDTGRFDRDAAAKESVRSEAAKVHADVVAALAAATLKIEELESQLLLQHERAEAYDGRDLAVHAKSGRRDGDDCDDEALTSAVTESAVAEGYKQSNKESYNGDAPQACVEKDVWSDIWMFDQVSSPTGILHVRSSKVSDMGVERLRSVCTDTDKRILR